MKFTKLGQGFATTNRPPRQKRLSSSGAPSYLCKVNEVLALTRDHERRAVAAIASRFNRVEPSHGQEAFASASTASPQLACRLAAPPGHESGLPPDTNRHEKLGVSTQGSGVGERNCFLFPFPIRVACEAGVFVCGEISPERSELRQQSLEGCRIRVAGIRRRPKVEAARRRRTKDAWVSG